MSHSSREPSSVHEVNVVVGGTPTTDSCNFDLTTDLILSTISVHSYNFIFPNVGVGVYTVATMFDQISLSSSFGAYSRPWRSYVTH